MKKYNSSALTTNRSEVLEEAAKNGVIIQEKNTNGKVRREFALVLNNEEGFSNILCDELQADLDAYMKNSEYLGIASEQGQKLYNKSMAMMVDRAKEEG